MKTLLYRYLILLFFPMVVVGTLHAQIIYQANVCSNTTNSQFVQAQTFGESSISCDSGSELEYRNLGGDRHLVRSIWVERLDSGPHRARLNIEWWPNDDEGTVTVDLYYRRKVWEGWCRWHQWNILYSYRITKRSTNPGGSLQISSMISGDNPRVTVPITYQGDNSVNVNASRVEYTLFRGETQVSQWTLNNTNPTSRTINGYGNYTVRTRLYEPNCNKWHEGPFRSFSFVPSCYNDNAFTTNVQGENVRSYPEGYQVDAGNPNLLHFSGITNFENFYRINHDGGEDLEIDQSGGVVHFKVLNPLGSYRITAEKSDLLGDYCLPSHSVRIFTGGRDVTLEQVCAIELPRDMETEFGYRPENDPEQLVLQHFAATVKSKKKIVVRPGMVLEQGAELVLEHAPPGIGPDDPDLPWNFAQMTAFNDYGEVTGETRSYFDASGKPVQVQSKSSSKGVILASETLYDAIGRPVIHTLAAPVWSEIVGMEDECGDIVETPEKLRFKYKEGFVTGADGGPYGPENYDGARELDPVAVGSTGPGSLGWYYSMDNGLSATPSFNEPQTAITSYPYSRALFHEDGSGDLKSATVPGDVYKAGSGKYTGQDKEAVEDGDQVLAAYLDIRQNELHLPSPTVTGHSFFKETVRDADGRRTEVYHDKEGKAIVSAYYGTGNAPILKSYSFYNLRGELVCSVSPNGTGQYESGTGFADIDKTTYEHNLKGFVTAVQEKDAGRTEYLYSKDGKVRFSQNAEQAQSGKYSYTLYDRSHRPIESGEFMPGTEGPGFGSAGLTALLDKRGEEGRLSGGSYADVIVTYYDFADTNVPYDKPQKFVTGAVSSTAFYPQGTENAHNAKTWYSYDERGRAQWLVQDITGLGAKTIGYKYGPDGNIKEVAYQRGGPDAYYHYYEYDADGRLQHVYSGKTAPVYNSAEEITNLDGLTHQASYDYYVHGPLKRQELPQAKQGLDYLYTVDGKLKAVNSGSLGNGPGGDGHNGFDEDLFGMALDYHANDFASRATGPMENINYGANATDRFTGNIKGQRWHSPVDGGAGKAYAYTYDDRDQLQQAGFGSIAAGAYVPSTAYQEKINGYDANGNIQGLERRDGLGGLEDNFTYLYEANGNKLLEVRQGDEVYLKYAYNAIGQMTGQESPEGNMYLSYDVTGKVTGVHQDAARTKKLVGFSYDDRGFRLGKTSYDSLGSPAWRTWYVRDGSGLLLSTYVENLTEGGGAVQYELPIYGADRIGSHRPFNNTDYYELKDHLGNVRVLIGGPQTVEYLATLESELVSQEEPYFENIDLVRTPTASYINHTPATDEVPEPNKVIRVNNYRDAPRKVIGGGISLPVMAGDKIGAEVFVKYANFNSSDQNFVPGLAGYLASSFQLPVGVDGNLVNIFSGLEGFRNSLPLWLDGYDEGQPRAYLNYILFDKNFVPLDFGFQQVSEAAEIPVSGQEAHLHERLSVDIEITEPGFIYIYVSNENGQDMDVYFDDFKVSHTFSDVVFASDYYPFGLAMEDRKIEREQYRFGYQGQFAEKDEETGWNAFELRMYNSRIGRWMAVDPARQFASPYVGMGNNPVNGVDPDGAYSWFGAWWRNGFSREGMVQSGGEWGIVKETGGMVTDFGWRNGEGFSFSYKETYQDFGSSGGGGKTIDNFTNIVGPAEFYYNLAIDGHLNASRGAKGTGFGLSFLTTSLDGYQVYNQFKQGGVKNINPMAATGLTVGTIGITAKTLEWLGVGGRLVSPIGTATNFVGMSIAVGQSWWNIYKPMNDLRNAPSYIDKNGNPYYHGYLDEPFPGW